MQIEYGNWFIRIYKSEDITMKKEKPENVCYRKGKKPTLFRRAFNHDVNGWMKGRRPHETARKKVT